MLHDIPTLTEYRDNRAGSWAGGGDIIDDFFVDDFVELEQAGASTMSSSTTAQPKVSEPGSGGVFFGEPRLILNGVMSFRQDPTANTLIDSNFKIPGQVYAPSIYELWDVELDNSIWTSMTTITDEPAQSTVWFDIKDIATESYLSCDRPGTPGFTLTLGTLENTNANDYQMRLAVRDARYDDPVVAQMVLTFATNNQQQQQPTQVEWRLFPNAPSTEGMLSDWIVWTAPEPQTELPSAFLPVVDIRSISMNYGDILPVGANVAIPSGYPTGGIDTSATPSFANPAPEVVTIAIDFGDIKEAEGNTPSDGEAAGIEPGTTPQQEALSMDILRISMGFGDILPVGANVAIPSGYPTGGIDTDTTPAVSMPTTLSHTIAIDFHP